MLIVGLAVVVTACSAAVVTDEPRFVPPSSGSPEATAEPVPSIMAAGAPKGGITGPATAVVDAPEIEPVALDPNPILPASVTDMQGTAVTVDSVDRILALDLYGSTAATVYGLGLGDRLIGRDISTEFPGVTHLPVVTSNGHQLNAEAILELQPTVLITDTTLGPWNAVLQVRDAGVPVVVVDPERSLESIDTLIEQIAAALGVPAEGELLSARLAQEREAVAAAIDRIAPADPADRLRIVFLYARGQAGVFYIFGKGSGADALIEAVDGIDVATDAGIIGFTPLNAEALSRTRPDVILMMSMGLESLGGVDGALQLPGVGQTPAGQHRRIVDMSDYQVLSFGPLTAHVLDALARALYAPDAAPLLATTAEETP